MSIIYKLGSLVNIYKGSTLITKKYIDENQGIYPVISSKTTENGIYGFINRYDYEKNKITMSLIGENAGTFFWQEKNFSLTNNACVFISNKNINYNYKYLFITLKKHEYKIKEFIVIGSARPMISSNHLKLVDVNLPSIEIQDAIISIIEPIEKVINNIKNIKIKIESLINKYFDFLYSDLEDSNFKKYILGDLFTINRGQIINSKYIYIYITT
ncbi:restriction modification enzyme subunit s2a [Ureaplasma urealyticum serovar 10 str. ATCC 33699]|uniref:Restriction modification enzyme subunit s2a n=1 Tax=Ureaplasma urealyticum serovar 10 (strain ATCC 33699 / Western) TaxID=565575 RepID=B5ZAL2_UREU1